MNQEMTPLDENRRCKNQPSETLIREIKQKAFKEGYIAGFTDGMEKGQQHVLDNLFSIQEKMKESKNDMS